MFLSFPDIVEDPFGIAPEFYSNVGPLSESETYDYIAHRLRLAGNRRDTVFAPDALALVYRVSNGDPRSIDEVCSIAMKCAFASSETVVSRSSVSMAADRIGKKDLDRNDLPDANTGRSVHDDAPAKQDWLEVSREFGVQNQIIGRLRQEVTTRTSELDGLQSQVAELTRAKREWQRETEDWARLQSALSSAEEKIEKLQAQYDVVSSENGRLAGEIKELARKNELPAPQQIPANESIGERREQAEPNTNSKLDSRPRLTVVAADCSPSHDEIMLSDERVLVPLDSRSSEHYRIRTGRLGLGSNLDNDFPIKSRYVSPHHARIDSDDSNSVIVDLNSTNGTFVNGKRVSRRALRDGDEIWIGKSKFQFVRQLVERRPSHSKLAGPGSGDNLSSSRFSALRHKPLKP